MHAPATDSGLSSNVGDYYYAYGATPGSCKLLLGRKVSRLELQSLAFRDLRVLAVFAQVRMER